jgi:hypothetical protein
MTDFDKLTEINNTISELEADRDGLNAIWFVTEYIGRFVIGHLEKNGSDPIFLMEHLPKATQYISDKIDKIQSELESLYTNRDFWQEQVNKGEDE